MEDKQKELLWGQLVARVGTGGAAAVFDVVGLGKKADMKPLEGRYRLALVDVEALLPDCPFFSERRRHWSLASVRKLTRAESRRSMPCMTA